MLLEIHFAKRLKVCLSIFTKAASCILNEGFTTGLVSVNRGVRHGDPLSSLLFILSLEILSDYIRQDENIQGIKINSKETKLTFLAVDLTCFVKDKIFYFFLFASLKIFS